MAHVFVSHASADGRTAEQARRWLATDGHDVFLAQAPGDGIALGEEWQRRLYERLRWADAVVCLVSQAYRDSTWCTAELAIAHERGRRILPILVEPGPPHPLVSALQHTDYTADPDTARAALRDTLRRLDAAGGRGWPDDRSPFPGLLAFDTDMHRAFFGRRGEVDQLAALLRSPAAGTEPGLHVVVGPSGCGKSSLVRAGLLPLMADEPGWWTLPPVVPGTDPVTALARALAAEAHRTGLDWTLEHVLHRLEAGEPHGLSRLAESLLLAATHGRGRRLLVVVDQLEELVTLTPPVGRRHFSTLLAYCLAGPVQVVATARPEALAQLLASPELAGVPLRPYPLRPLDHQMLPVVIEEPARLAGIGVDPQLVARLVADTGSGEALPLLAFTLAELAEGVPRGGELSTRRYEELGGVQGALVRQADAALAAAGAASGRAAAEVVAGLLWLVGVDEHGNPTRRRVARANLPEPVRVETDAFVARRLLTADQDTTGAAVVEVAHEAVLTAWPPLAEAVGAAATALRAGRLVERAAADWDQAGRPSTRLWGGDQLAGAVADTGAHRVRGKGLVTDRLDLTQSGRDFLAASRRRDRRRRTWLVSVLSGLLALALVAAGTAYVQQRQAQTQRREAEAQHALALSRQLAANSVALRKSRRATAEQLAAAALKVALTDEARNSAGALLADYRTTMAQPGGISASTFSPDGRTIATGSATNGQVWLWDSVTRTPRARIETGHNAISIVRYSPDGGVLATADREDGTVRLWDLGTGHPLGAPLTGHSNGVGDIVFAPDERTVMTYDSQQVGIRVWDTRTGELRTTLALDNFEPSAMALSPDGRRLATGDGGGTVRFWNAATGQPESKPLNGQAGAIRAVSFSPNGNVVQPERKGCGRPGRFR